MILSQYFQNWSLRLLNYEKSSSLWCSGTVHGLCYLSEIWHQDSKKTKEPHCKVPERLMINFLYKKQNLNFLPFLPREFFTAGTFTECVQTIYSSENLTLRQDFDVWALPITLYRPLHYPRIRVHCCLDLPSWKILITWPI